MFNELKQSNLSIPPYRSITLSIVEPSTDGGGEIDSSATLLPHGLVSTNDVEYHGMSYYKVLIGREDRNKVSVRGANNQYICFIFCVSYLIDFILII